MKVLTKCSMLVLCVLLTDVRGFAPIAPVTTRTTQLTMATPQKEKPWYDDIADWFSHLGDETVEKTKKKDDDWVAKEFNEIGEQEETIKTEKKEDDLVAEKTEVQEETTKTEKKEDDWVAKEFNEVEEQEETTKTKKKGNEKWYDWGWITKGLEKVGKSDVTEDHVAEDMEKAGKVGEKLGSDWIAQDMKEAGSGPHHTQHLKKKKDKKQKTKQELIAEDMEKTGKEANEDRVVQDMKMAGRARDKASLEAKKDKLGEILDKRREHDYDDVFDDMEKAGKAGSSSKAWVEEDMKRAGRAGSAVENLSHRDVTYKRSDMAKKRSNVKEIREDMEAAGHAESSDWVAQDLKMTGRSHQGVPKNKDSAKWLEYEQETEIGKDMIAEGKARPGQLHTQSNVYKGRREQDIADDLKATGKSGSSSWIARDLERAGRPEAHLNKETTFASHKQRETDAVENIRMASHHDPLPHAYDPSPIIEEEEPVEEEHHRGIISRVRKALTRVIHPSDTAVAKEDVKENAERKHFGFLFPKKE